METRLRLLADAGAALILIGTIMFVRRRTIERALEHYEDLLEARDRELRDVHGLVRILRARAETAEAALQSHPGD